MHYARAASYRRRTVLCLHTMRAAGQPPPALFLTLTAWPNLGLLIMLNSVNVLLYPPKRSFT